MPGRQVSFRRGGRSQRCKLLSSRRLAAVACILGTATVYYLYHYQGMKVHVELPGGLLTLAADKAPGRLSEKPLGVPRFDNLVDHEIELEEVQPIMVADRPRPTTTRQKPTDSRDRQQQQRRRRRVKGAREYLDAINVTFLHLPSLRECAASRLIFAVASPTGETRGQRAVRQRQAVRQTWGSNLAELPDAWRGCVVFYALADSPAAELELLEEAQHEQDVIVLTATRETFNEWAPRELDVIATGHILFQLAAMHPSANYVVRTNHKAFWNVQRLTGTLRPAGNETRRLAGKVLRSDWVHRDPGDPAYISRDQLPDQMYPESALSDPGYAVSAAALRAMDRLAETTPLVYSRDMYITGVLRSRAGAELELLADIKISKAYPVSPCYFRLFVATPSVDAEEMHRVWAKFNDANHKCSYTILNDADLF